MSFLRSIWAFIRRPTGFVGKDLEGNKFYEYPAAFNDPRRTTRRVVKYQGKRDLLDYATEGKQLPAQWRAWLSHTRIHPPSLQELQRDLNRQRQILHNASIIEARDQEERRRLSAAPANNGAVDNKDDSNLQTHGQASNSSPASETSSNSQSRRSPWIPQPDTYEPQSWIPRSSQRGQ